LDSGAIEEEEEEEEEVLFIVINACRMCLLGMLLFYLCIRSCCISSRLKDDV
jgi:hypothetical protein